MATMDAKVLIERLNAQADLFPRILNDVPPGRICWNPAPGKWSLLEVVCHLRDEEREDFRQRLRLTLEDPSQPWPGIDPPGWVTERAYAEQEWSAVLADFLAERNASLRWLDSLDAPAWENVHEHPHLGTIRAGDLLTSWAGHDLLHIRQILGLEWAWNARRAAPYTPDYAGEW